MFILHRQRSEVLQLWAFIGWTGWNTTQPEAPVACPWLKNPLPHDHMISYYIYAIMAASSIIIHHNPYLWMIYLCTSSSAPPHFASFASTLRSSVEAFCGFSLMLSLFNITLVHWSRGFLWKWMNIAYPVVYHHFAIKVLVLSNLF